jgi:enoyl-CoA hydratase/3-hydroxyacyl-CoA dehydrogenase
MAYSSYGRKISKIGVVGSGQIGPDIALYFSRVLQGYDVPVVVTDILESALDAGSSRIRKKLDKGVQTGAFTKDQADTIYQNIIFTTQKERLRGADLVIEAATEDLRIKQSIFAELEQLCPESAILASNSSHIEPEAIFANTRVPERALVIHYFFPAERNMLVEIVPGEKTSPRVTEFCMRFYESIGKAPIHVKSRYGYAVDPIFEGLFQAAALCVEEGLANTKVVDAIACKALGLGVGPFTAMNLTGGNPITQHGLNQMHTKIMEWFKSPSILDRQISFGRPWEAQAKEEKIEYDEVTYRRVSDDLMGAYFGLACEVLQSGITNIGDLEMAIELGLVMRPPFGFMNQMGISNALELVQKYSRKYPSFKVPQILVEQARSKMPWKIPYVFATSLDGITIIKIRRPRTLNALNKEVFSQLYEHFEAVRDNPGIKGVILTGFGTKAFVSGADVAMLAAVKSAEEGERLSQETHKVLNLIENLGKPVVCAMNGLALGGGNELAMVCSARIAKKGLPVLVGQPEPKLGIIPGAGATQRLPRIIGIEKAWELLRTGKTISSREAKQIGLILDEVDGDVVDAAVGTLRDILDGKIKLKVIPTQPIHVPEELPEVDIGPLSRKIDLILKRAILEGAKLGLGEGLKLESKLFGECCQTKDMRIGLENFVKTGLKEPAKFIHE